MGVTAASREDARQKRLEKLKALENDVTARIAEPWETKAHDLVLCRQLE
jgi:hypothetical protein